MDWGAYSREAVAMMSAGTSALFAKHGLALGRPYQWDLDARELVMAGVHFGLLVVGTVAGDSFLWGWADESLPSACVAGLERVRRFGEEHDLGLLVSPCAPGGLAQAKECVALAGRVLDAGGVFFDRTESGFIGFLLFELVTTAKE